MRTERLNFPFMLELLDMIEAKSDFEQLKRKSAEFGINLRREEYDRLYFYILHNMVSLTIKLEEQEKIRILYVKRDVLLNEMSKLSNSLFKKGKLHTTKDKIELINKEISALEEGTRSIFEDVFEICGRITESILDMLQIEDKDDSIYYLESEVLDHFQDKLKLILA